MSNLNVGSRQFDLSGWRLGAVALGLAGAFGMVLYLGYQQHRAASLLVPAREFVAAVSEQHDQLRATLMRQREEVEQYQLRAHGHTDVTALRLGVLQVQTLRLEALGNRLADMAGLDGSEFTVDAPIGLGGPQPTVELKREVGFYEKLLADIDVLEQQLRDREAAMYAMEGLLMEHEVQDRSTPQSAPVKNGWVSSAYGYRADPFTGRREFHQGVDISGGHRAKIHAVAAGVVVFSGYRGGHGRTVEIDHGEGYKTSYSHNRENLVEVGQWVSKGEPVAIMGSSGRSTGAHVHFEVLENGRSVNPSDYISLK